MSVWLLGPQGCGKWPSHLGSPGGVKHPRCSERQWGLGSAHSHSLFWYLITFLRPSWRLQSELITSTGKTALFSPSRDSDPQACLQAKDYKIFSWKASTHDTPEVSLSLRLSQAGLNPTKKHMGLIFCLFAFPLLDQGPQPGPQTVAILDPPGVKRTSSHCSPLTTFPRPLTHKGL